jgi:hypothetical protein
MQQRFNLTNRHPTADLDPISAIEFRKMIIDRLAREEGKKMMSEATVEMVVLHYHQNSLPLVRMNYIML